MPASCFLQKARDASGTKLVFNKAVLSENKANVSEAFHVDYGFDPEEKDPVTNRHVDTMQDIFYHNAYGLFIPVCKRIDGDIVKAIIYHVSKEDVQKAMSSAEVETLHPDFGIVIDKSMKNPPELTDGDSYDAYEVESMDISRKLHKMILCANISYRVNNSYDAFYILNTLTFN